MKFTIDPGILADLIRTAATSVPGRPNPPILGGILIEANIGAVTLSAYDYEQATSATGVADVTEPGVAVASGRLLADIAKVLPKRQTVTVTIDGTELVIEHGRTRFGCPLMDHRDYPGLPAVDDTHIIGTVDADAFVNAITTVAPFILIDPTLPMLGAVHIESDDNNSTLTMVTTDRHSLASVDVEWLPAAGVDAFNLNVPAASLLDAVKAIDGHIVDNTLTLWSDRALLGIKAHDVTVTVRILDVDFVRWRALVPDSYGTVAVIRTDELVAATKRAEATTSADRVHMIVDYSNGYTVDAPISVSGTDGRLTDAMPVTACHGDEVRFKVDAAKLRRAAHAAAGGNTEITVGFAAKNPTRMLVIHPGVQEIPEFAPFPAAGTDARVLLMGVNLAEGEAKP